MSDVVEADGVTKAYKGVTVVDQVDMTVRAGEICGLLGRNGAGKSTIMRMVGSVTARDAGRLAVFGMDPSREGARIRARIGVVPQDDTLDVELTVWENLYVYGRYFGIPKRRLRAVIPELLHFAQLSDRAGTPVQDLSGGMRRRTTLARSLVNRPELVLLDEPTTGLDPQSRQVLWERMRSLKREGRTLLLTTHYMEEAQRLCDRIMLIQEGRILDHGSPAELIARHLPPEVVEVQQDDTCELASSCARLRELRSVHAAELTADSVLLYCESGNRVIDTVLSDAFDLRTSKVTTRPTNLEDVFLKITGRGLGAFE